MATVANATTLAQQQPQPNDQAGDGSGYAFSSAALRKKKQGKKGSRKLRNKKFITAEEAVSRKGRVGPENHQLSRSHSTSALLTSRTLSQEISKTQRQTKARPPTKPPVATPKPAVAPAISPSSGSPVGNSRSIFVLPSEGQQEHELDLSSSARLRNTRKPWETDIRKKHKTEYGDRLLRENGNGPMSADRTETSRAASKRGSFRRSRSLSTTRRHSLPSDRLLFGSQRSSPSPSGSEGSRGNGDAKDLSDEISPSDHEDKTYEKYRQFLASTKSDDSDETSRQSVLSLKQKVGAAPSLSFSYRYSAAADELLGLADGNCDFVDSTGDEALTATERETDASELDDLVAGKEDTESAEGPVCGDGVVHDTDSINGSDDGESQCKEQASLRVREQEVNSPLPSPVSFSSPHRNPAPLEQLPSPTESTKESIQLERTDQSEHLEETEENLDTILDDILLSSESNLPRNDAIVSDDESSNDCYIESDSVCLEEKSACPSESESGKFEEKVFNTQSQTTTNEETRSIRIEGIEKIDAYDSGCEDELGDSSCNNSQNTDSSQNTEECAEKDQSGRGKADDCELEASHRENHNNCPEVYEESSTDCYIETDSSGPARVVTPTGGVEETDAGERSRINTKQELIRDTNSERSGVEEPQPIMTYDNDDGDNNDNSSFQDGEDSDYPEEDRQLLSLLYHIHTS